MRFMLFATAALLAACSPPSNNSANTNGAPDTPVVIACNDVAPDATQAVTLGDDVAVAAAVSDLRGGRVAPGTYDLVSGGRVGGAAGWSGGRAVALNVSEAEAGTIFNWASAAPNGDVERWTAGFIDAPSGHITYTCGRVGGADVDFTAEPTGLRLQLPEISGTGSLYLIFARRA